MEIPFEVGALYNRQRDIHARYGGQKQGGISTPVSAPLVIIFTGESGKPHGYEDFWDDDGVFHYYGEGQSGDMQDVRGNRAILRHDIDAKALLLFQMMGRGKPYRYLGEFKLISAYQKPGVIDRSGAERVAIVFRLSPVNDQFSTAESLVKEPKLDTNLDLGETFTKQVVAVRKKQGLFRKRLIVREKGCRITGIRDLRFLIASHIKPWSHCISGSERVDGNNGLLLSPQADALFDQGWITFDDQGRLVRSDHLPKEVTSRTGLVLQPGRNCGAFNSEQQRYLEFHRNQVFDKAFSNRKAPVEVLLDILTTPA